MSAAVSGMWRCLFAFGRVFDATSEEDEVGLFGPASLAAEYQRGELETTVHVLEVAFLVLEIVERHQPLGVHQAR